MADRSRHDSNSKDRSSGGGRRSSRVNSSGSSGGGTNKTSGNSSSVSSSTQSVEEMYKIYEKINSATDKSELEKEYRVFFTSVSKSENEKRLASQFIPRFLDSFPGLAQDAFDALLDLCEDDDPLIRRQVVKDVVTACQKIPKFVPKIADVLGQLMEAADALEIAGIERALTSLFHIDAQGAMLGLFNQISLGEDLVRERAIKFLAARVKDLGPEIINPTFEKSLLDEAKRYLLTAPADDFKEVLNILTSTRYYKQLGGQQALVDILVEIGFVGPFNASDENSIQRLIVLTNYGLGLFSSQISATPFVSYYCREVIPKLTEICELPEGRQLRDELCKHLANCASFVTRMEEADANECLIQLFHQLKLNLELPPENPETPLKDSLEYGYIECLMYSFHKVSVYYDKFLLKEPDTLADYRRRLQYLARGTQAAMTGFSTDLQNMQTTKPEELKLEHSIRKVMSLKLFANINSMIRDVFRNPPTFKADIVPSWRPLAKANKRKAESTTALAMLRTPKERQLYQPPSGKFSARGGRGFGSPRGGGSRGGYRGSYRSFNR